MKIAVQISGLPRFFKSSFPYLKQYILDKYDCDIFIHTFQKFDSAPMELIGGSFRYKDEGTIDEYLSLYKPKHYLIEGWTDYLEEYFIGLEKKYKVNSTDNFGRRYTAMLYGINKCNDLRREYEFRMNFEYDYVIRTRPDMVMNGFELPKKELSIDHHGNGKHVNAPGDCFACGKRLMMDYYADLWHSMDYYVTKKGVPLHTEHLLEYHLKIKDYEVSRWIKEVFRPPEWNAAINR